MSVELTLTAYSYSGAIPKSRRCGEYLLLTRSRSGVTILKRKGKESLKDLNKPDYTHPSLSRPDDPFGYRSCRSPHVSSRNTDIHDCVNPFQLFSDECVVLFGR